MKAFLAIVAASALVFIALGMVEERDVFARNWFRPPAAPQTNDARKDEVVDAVRMVRALASHLYASDGDARFAERLPASQALVDELRGDVRYVRNNGRIESPQLVRMDVRNVSVHGDTAEVETREYWITSYAWASGGGRSDATRSDIIAARYRLAREGSKWIVTAWDPIDAEAR